MAETADKKFEKKFIHNIGVPGFPFPVLRDKKKTVGGKEVTVKDIAVVESPDEHYTLRSARESTAEVYGHLYRNLPVRSMLPALEHLFKHADMNQSNFTLAIVGDPGDGKTFLARTFCELRDPRGPIMSDVGGQNMGDLLYRIVFNSEERKTLMEMMDEALANNELHELSLKALELLGDGFHHAEGEQLWIDWKEVGDKVDPNLRDNTLAAVFKLQNWDSKASSIGFKIEEGALIRADIENRDLIVDEYNKSLPDSETPLQIVMQVLNGETKRHIVNLGGKGSYELVNAHESGKGNLFLATGNHPKDGTGTRKMSDSWNRRMQPFTIPSFTQDDWYDRTAQILTGLPIPILERMVPGKWTGDKWQVNDPKAFTETLLMLQTLGMTDAQRVRVPEWQTSLITHWETALPPIEKLAHFYYKWQQLVDRDSPLMKSGKFPGILMEIDDDLVPVEKVTPSTMIGHINEAKVLSPKARPAEQSGGFSLKTNWDIPVQTRKVEAEPIAKNFGSRLVASILDEIERTTLQKGKKELYEQLMEDAKEAGLIGNPPPLAAALNIDPSKDKEAQAKTVQNMLCTELRKRYPHAQLPDDDNDIMPLAQVAAQLDTIRNSGRDATISPFTTELLVANTDINAGGAFKRVAADSGEKKENLADLKKRLPASDLLEAEQLLTSLALPVVGLTNIKALWNKALTDGGFSPNEETMIAQDASSSTGLAMTTLFCQGTGDKANEYTPLHVLANHKTKRTLVIGDGAIDDVLYDKLKRNRIVYINRQFPGADVWVNTEIRGIVEPQFEGTLRKAFLLRNSPVGGKTDASLAQLLTDETLTHSEKPNFITNLDPSKISHVQRQSNRGDDDIVNLLT